MAGNESFGGAMSEMWSNLLYGTGSYKALRWFLAIILLAGTIWSGFMFKKVLDFSKPTQIAIPPAKNAAADDARRLEGIIRSFREAVLARSGSSAIAMAAATSSRMPFVVTVKPAPEPEPGSEAALAGGPGVGADVIPGQPEDVLPPFITVRAIMTLGSLSNAVLDIENEGEALVVRPGFTFGDGLGRVKSIKPNEVIIEWAGKDMEIPAGK